MLVLFMLKRQKGKFLGAYSCDQEDESYDDEAKGNAGEEAKKIVAGGALNFEVSIWKKFIYLKSK